MPNAIVHYTFAKKYALDCPKPYLKALCVGAQGPDPFFFYGMIPRLGRPFAKEVRSLGGITQHQEITPNTIALIEYAKHSPDKDLLFAYIDGLFMHYAVDRACHPYIFYKTGFTDRECDDEQVHRYYNFGHLCMEVFLDLIIGKKEGTFGSDAKCLSLKEKELKKISAMWAEANKKAQQIPHIEKDSFAKCIHDYRAAAHITYSRFGIKKALIGKFLGKHSFAYGFSAPRNLKGFEGCDFLNASHADWYMPDNSGPRHESFEELLNVEARQIYESCHACLEKAKRGEAYEKELTEAGAHLNHEGIVPGSPKLTWKLIWPKEFQVDIIEPNITHK